MFRLARLLIYYLTIQLAPYWYQWKHQWSQRHTRAVVSEDITLKSRANTQIRAAHEALKKSLEFVGSVCISSLLKENKEAISLV